MRSAKSPRVQIFAIALAASAVVLRGSARPVVAAAPPAVAVKRIADSYLAEFSRRFPAEATVAGIPGIRHERAIDYLVTEAGDSPTAAAFRIDRQAAFPGQMLSYAVGRLEIQRLREEAQGRLGRRFDIREFHERVLENGNVTLPMLREHVERWLAGSRP